MRVHGRQRFQNLKEALGFALTLEFYEKDLFVRSFDWHHDAAGDRL